MQKSLDQSQQLQLLTEKKLGKLGHNSTKGEENFQENIKIDKINLKKLGGIFGNQ